MSNTLNRRQEIAEQKAKFKELSFNEKLGYIRDYYWVHIVFTIIAVIVIIALYHTYQDKNFNTVLSAVLINNDTAKWDEDAASYESILSDTYEEYLGIDGVKDRFVVDNNYILDYARDSEMSIYSAESLMASIMGSRIDIHIGDALSMEYFCEDDYTFFYELDQLFDEDFLKQYEDRIYYHTYEDGQKVPVAFDVTDCKVITDAGLTIEPVYLGVFANTKRLEASADYLRFVLSSAP
jgi:hypothetical protein